MTQIAIACQGGALHAAFTAGALKKIFERLDEGPYEIMGLSGTSAGALCAVASWYGLLTSGPAEAIRVLDAVWADFAAVTPTERAFNAWLVGSLRVQGQWVAADVRFSPYAPFFPALLIQLRLAGAREEFVDYSALLNKHINFDTVSTSQPVNRPWLLVGAVNVLSGDFKAFSSKETSPNDNITADAVRASGAIPGFGTRAVRIGDDLFWDGVYSQNPPVRNFLADPETAEDKPDEIWVIQLNPTARKDEPKSVADIQDRDNELAANLSLGQETKFIDDVNEWIAQGYLPPEKYKTVTVRTLAMSQELSDSLDYASKLDRSRSFIETLMAEGERQAEIFLTGLR
ncbi:MAG: patatin-like phospholipase family protein [Anaerolineae bacterium]|nr:patatin-like phospholipase family protein [Anaerolineae bacterium]